MSFYTPDFYIEYLDDLKRVRKVLIEIKPLKETSLKETSNGVTVGIKPHTSSTFATAPWYSTYFTYPLPSNFVFKSGNYKRKYIWERTN